MDGCVLVRAVGCIHEAVKMRYDRRRRTHTHTDLAYDACYRKSSMGFAAVPQMVSCKVVKKKKIAMESRQSRIGEG